MTQERLNEIFDYHEHGFFVEKGARSKCSTTPGKHIKGTLYKSGYKMLTIDKKLRQMHRMVFLWHHGFLPTIVDHINRVRGDNRIENLRAATKQLNQANSRLSPRNKSGFRGVHWDGFSWIAGIRVNKERRDLGRFRNKEDAARRYDEEARKIFGDFAYINFR